MCSLFGEVNNLHRKHGENLQNIKITNTKIQTMNKTVFIPDKAHNQNLPPYQHKVCAPIRSISHIVSSLLQCGLQRNYQYSALHTISVLFLVLFGCIFSERNY